MSSSTRRKTRIGRRKRGKRWKKRTKKARAITRIRIKNRRTRAGTKIRN